jgi:hypothetical protein
MVSHDQVTRFLASDDFDAKTLWQLVKPLVRELESDRDVLIIDDTIEEKPYTDESELVCWHFDHSQGKSVKGINIVNLLYEVEGVRVPVATKPWIRPCGSGMRSGASSRERVL